MRQHRSVGENIESSFMCKRQEIEFNKQIQPKLWRGYRKDFLHHLYEKRLVHIIVPIQN